MFNRNIGEGEFGGEMMERFGRRCPVVESTGAVRRNVRNTYRAICGWFTTLPVTTFSKPQLSTLLIVHISNNYETYDNNRGEVRTDQKFWPGI